MKIKTAYALGLANVFCVMFHRVKLKVGFESIRRLSAITPQGPFFLASERPKPDWLAPNNWQQEALYFGWWSRAIGESPPDWHQNPMNGERAVVDCLWSKLPDFDARVGDIKLVWEASRWTWVLAFSQHIRLGDQQSLLRLNDWLADWCASNVPYRGANWKCGQEASIRVLHLAMAALILDQVKKPLPGIVDLVRLHLQRIRLTLRYAMSQDNNHGTSEAAALFVGGSWLASLGVNEGPGWQKLGRKWLENRANRLIGHDGSFSQYSVNYHRVMLDTLSMVEVWRRTFDLPIFSARLQSRLIAAVHWLAAVVDPQTGDAPNLGANDGARLLPLTDTDDRDFRPTVQLAMVLFCGQRAYEADGDWNLPLAWLGIARPDSVSPQPASRVFDEGGLAVLRCDHVMALLRYPRFRFRPSQSDVLHVDLWKDGLNLLRDAGTYSYHADPEYLRYFPGTMSHNTIQFDDRDQMPRLSRFLFGAWLKPKSIDALADHAGQASFGASYCDHEGVYHQRRIQLTKSILRVIDVVDGFKSRAVLRWRLSPGTWTLDGVIVSNGGDRITIEASMPILRMTIAIGWESRYYSLKTAVPVLEIEVNQPGTICSEYEWKP